jgi:hypothetical protein
MSTRSGFRAAQRGAGMVAKSTAMGYTNFIATDVKLCGAMNNYFVATSALREDNT